MSVRIVVLSLTANNPDPGLSSHNPEGTLKQAGLFLASMRLNTHLWCGISSCELSAASWECIGIGNILAFLPSTRCPSIQKTTVDVGKVG